MATAVWACSLVTTSGGERRIVLGAGGQHEQPAPEGRQHERVALGRGALLRLAIAHQLDADHQPAAADIADDAVAPRQLRELCRGETRPLRRRSASGRPRPA